MDCRILMACRMTRLISMLLIVMRNLAESLRPVKRHEQHAKSVERRDEYAGQHAEVGVAGSPAMRGAHRFDDRILRIEAGEERRADERQGADPRGYGGDGHVLGKAPHLPHILLVMHAD